VVSVRLLHLQEGSSRRCREIVRLLDIRSIEQRQELSVTLKQRPALRITLKGISSLGSVLSVYGIPIGFSKSLVEILKNILRSEKFLKETSLNIVVLVPERPRKSLNVSDICSLQCVYALYKSTID